MVIGSHFNTTWTINRNNFHHFTALIFLSFCHFFSSIIINWIYLPAVVEGLWMQEEREPSSDIRAFCVFLLIIRVDNKQKNKQVDTNAGNNQGIKQKCHIKGNECHLLIALVCMSIVPCTTHVEGRFPIWSCWYVMQPWKGTSVHEGFSFMDALI